MNWTDPTRRFSCVEVDSLRVLFDQHQRDGEGALEHEPPIQGPRQAIERLPRQSAGHRVFG
jgi:hypothetical protein